MGRVLQRSRVACAAVVFSFIAAAQDTPRFQSDVSLVRVDAEATNGTRTLTGLTQGDFEIFDNGSRQEIVHFSEIEEPLDLILLFDVSSSLRELMKEVAAAARRALTALRPGDRVAVMAFATSRSRYVADFTEDFDAAERAIFDRVLGDVGENLRVLEGPTAIMAAVDNAVERFSNPRVAARRRAVLIVTDDLGIRSRREGSVVRKYWEADAVLTGVILTNKGLESIRRYNRYSHWRFMSQGMTGVAEKTGGDVVKENDPGEAFSESVRRLRQRYSIYYRAPMAKPGELRQVKVDLTADAKQRFPGGRVRARKGYVVPKTQKR